MFVWFFFGGGGVGIVVFPLSSCIAREVKTGLEFLVNLNFFQEISKFLFFVAANKIVGKFKSAKKVEEFL